MTKEEQKEALFIPSLDIERKYKEQLKTFLESNCSKTNLIDMGPLPPIYTTLGLSDKQLKTSSKTILKALGIEGKNKHHVPKEIIENLLSLTYDPEAVFKSLSMSDNPDAYIAVLNAKTEKQEQIIAILSPSHDGHGFTFIPTVYEKHNFERFLSKINDEQKILYIKNEGSELWGQLQSLPRHNSKPSTKNILTKNDIVKQFNKNILNKEKNMSDELEGIWTKDDKVSWYRESLKHTFGEPETNIEFLLSRRGLNKNDDPLLITIHDGFKSRFGDDSLTIRFEGDVDAAKKMIDDAIKVFDKKQNVNIYQIKDYFSFHMEASNDLRNAASFVDSFDHDQSKQEANKSTLEKINDHFEKNATVQPDGTVRVKGFAELSRELNKGKPYPGNALSFFVANGRLPTDDELAKMPKQGESPPLERRNFNSKENIMSDERQKISDQVDAYLAELKGTQPLSNEEEEKLSPNELAFRNAVHQRKIVAEAIKSGDLACLPGKDGYADTAPAYSIMNPDKFYHGSTLLYLKEIQRQNGFPTGEYVTYHQIEKAQKDGLDLHIDKGQKGVSLHVSEKNEVTDEYEDKHIRLFNVAQLNKPWEMKKWADQKIQEDEQKKIEYMKTQKGANWEPEKKKPKEPGPEIACSSTEPEKYLGQYFAAVSMGSKFKATPEQAAEFSEKMINKLYEPMKEKINKETGEIIPPPVSKTTGQVVTNPFSLEKISINANAECKNFMRDLRMQTQKQNQPERKQEQEQSIGRGM
ncbi:hypothetical protein R84B8_01836 [Treponema sp. R8-4-B8]